MKLIIGNKYIKVASSGANTWYPIGTIGELYRITDDFVRLNFDGNDWCEYHIADFKVMFKSYNRIKNLPDLKNEV